MANRVPGASDLYHTLRFLSQFKIIHFFTAGKILVMLVRRAYITSLEQMGRRRGQMSSV
jgi:hypothetical protein